MERTLEQVIMDASAEYMSPTGLGIRESEAAAIAKAVRGWMREQNEGLRKDIYQIIAAIDWEATSTSIVTDKILSVIPPQMREFEIAEEHMAYICKLEEECKRLKQKANDWDALMETGKVHPQKQDDIGSIPVSTGISPTEGEDTNKTTTLEEIAFKLYETPAMTDFEHQAGLQRVTTAIYEEVRRWSQKREEELEEQLHLRDAVLKAQGNVSPNDLAVMQKELEQERERTKYLEEELKATNNARAILQSEMNEYPIQRKRITELEKEATQPKILAEAADNLADLEARQSKRIKELEAEVTRLASLKSSPGCCDKVAKYDELRAKFPFLPGEEFWTLFQESVCKWTVEKIWFNDEGRLCLTGYRERINGSLLESPRYKASECHPTADACRAAIPVEE